ncbi:transmembrane protein [Arabidopsis thaliana]|uniref:Serine rich endogenous peptide 19 n=1 Tax=Arabidopsis thaliana TaxID=3702 RepID=SOP19_ARATH|nr:uncharacterized protein AT5G27765 [Arabidopsis thaliana]A0A1P8BD36.1 RecName: Full=Serine rich endogenous peptide 19; Short=AtSCOOP19; AltName: Full=Phytocytokine SCOOP19; AltName: Full=Precursor of serine rich endogenous peptide phytocytokine 19; Flags: Precursor [Arabidopsis thaliana]ANM69523.1 transmembrane protein [Arabidopsis thaliana]|eukprot:NP_001331193.1 transmembrane protein [Arabidopsis thaliana]
MCNIVVFLLTLTLFLFSGLSNTAFARVQYEPLKPKFGARVWDQKMIKNIKIEVDGSCSRRAPGRRRPPNRPPKPCTKP